MQGSNRARLAGVLAALFLSYLGVVSLKDGPHITEALVFFVIASGLLVFASWAVRVPEVGPSAVTDDEDTGLAFGANMTWERAYWLILLATAIAVAIWFRLYELDSKPYGIWFDEAQNGIVARSIIHGARPVFVPGITQLPALFFYVWAVGLEVFGNNITAMRLVTTIAGLGGVWFTYQLGKELFGQRAGIMAAFVLAIMRWHVNFSRFAMHGIFAPLFEVVALYYLVKGLKGKGQSNFLWSGIAIGIGMQSYYSFAILPIIVVLFVVHHWLLEKSLPTKQLAKGMAILIVSSVIIYMPVATWALSHWTEFSQRSQTVTITKGRTTSQAIDVAWTSARKHLLMFDYKGDRNGRHNIPGAPMLDKIMGALFILGFGFSLLNLKRSSCFLLVIWCILALQAGIWSLEFEAPQAYRTVGITPAIALLAALTLDRLWAVASDVAKKSRESGEAEGGRSGSLRWATGGAAVLSTALLLLSARTNYHNYFKVQLMRPDAFSENAADVTFASKEIHRLGSTHAISVAAVFNGQPTMQFLNSPDALKKAQTFDWSLSTPSTATEGAAYLLDSAKRPFWDWLRAVYPGGIFDRLNAPGTSSPDFAYEAIISSKDVQALQGLDAVYQPSSGAPMRRRDGNIDFDWGEKTPPVQAPFKASWQGTLRLSKYQDYTLVFDSPGPIRLTLDGKVLAEDTDHVEWKGMLYKGDHQLLIEADVQRKEPIRFSLDGAAVPPENLLSFPLQGHGLIASYFANQDWSGDPKLQELEPFIGVAVHSELDEVGRPFTASWTGFLEVPAEGNYAFEMEMAEKGTLNIDGHEFKDSELGKPVHLTKGRHPIEVRLLNKGGGARAFLYWHTPADPGRNVIAPQFLSPR